MRQHGQKFVLHGSRDGQLRRRFFVLPRSVILPQQRVSEHLQQFSVQDEPALRNGRLLPRHIPQVSEGHTGLAREPLDVRGLAEVDERIAGHGRADNLALEQKRRADNRQPVRLCDGDRGAILGLREASPDAFGQQAGIVAVLVEQGVQRGCRSWSADHLLAHVVERDGQVGHRAVFLQRGLPHGDVEERVVRP